MKSIEALRILVELTSYQWGMVTSAQASMRGITRLDLSRLTRTGHLVRLAHGVYMDAGTPGDEFDDLHAAWLSTDLKRLAEQRINDRAGGVVIAGASATRLHGIGDLLADRHDFVSPIRRQSQRQEVRYRQRDLDPQDVTLVEGMLVMTIERTIADLVEDISDLSLVADVLRDASEGRSLNVDRLKELLAPLAERNGFRKDDGAALLNRLMEVAGLDIESLSRIIAASPSLGALVARNYIGQASRADLAKLLISPEMERAMRSIRETFSVSFRSTITPHLELDASVKATMRSMLTGAGFQNATQKMAKQHTISDAMRAMAQSWQKPLGRNSPISPEIRSLAKTARQATARD